MDKDWEEDVSKAIKVLVGDRKDPKRCDHELAQSRVFTVDGFLSDDECRHYLAEAEQLGFESLNKEFKVDHRNNLRTSAHSPELAAVLFDRVKCVLNRHDVEGVRPIGQGNEGHWFPTGMDPWFKFSKYDVGTYFHAHMDLPYYISEDERTIYTVMIFLNDDFEGGKTNFFQRDEPTSKDEEVMLSIEPKLRRAILFNHDTRHAGAILTRGCKYILRSEIIFRRKDITSHSYQSDPEHQKVVQLYALGSEYEESADLERCHDVYHEALMLQASHPSIPVPSSDEDMGWLSQPDVVATIAMLLEIKDLGSLMRVSKSWNESFRHGRVWKSLYQARYPLTLEMETLVNNDNDYFLKDWYHTFSETYNRVSNSQTMVIDIGDTMFKFGLVKKGETAQLSSPMHSILGEEKSVHWSTSAYSEDDVVRVGEELENCSMNIYGRSVSLKAPTSVSKLVRWIFRFGVSKVRRPVEWGEEYPIRPVGEDALNPEDYNVLMVLPHQGVNEARLAAELKRRVPIKEVKFATPETVALAAVGRISGVVVDCGTEATHIKCVVDKNTVLATKCQVIKVDHKPKHFGARGWLDPSSGDPLPESVIIENVNGDPVTQEKLRNQMPILVQSVHDAIEACDLSVRDKLFKNVILVGGNAQWTGFSAMFQQEMLKRRYPFKLVEVEEPLTALVRGGIILSSLYQSPSQDPVQVAPKIDQNTNTDLNQGFSLFD
eukprot:TRINITY_DN5698_c0_g1_i5.p1 TRINITY_DN5698_c0_g1~~TRINITY_DN5698_c0_g1_i5.p1  ORF type:complete len:716 (-),score=113.85 TRINITY_DN5698_c0_g1_i5:50-2197(-)